MSETPAQNSGIRARAWGARRCGVRRSIKVDTGKELARLASRSKSNFWRKSLLYKRSGLGITTPI